MARHRSVLLAWLIVFLLPVSPPTQAQKPERRAVAATIPAPHSVLGFTPGDDRRIADWSQITDYFARLDKASGRVLVQTLGQSTLKRPLIVAFLSAPENILALNKYKEIQRRLADPRTVPTKIDRDRLISQGKVVIVISCSIHSTEIVASQMSVQLAYELAVAQDAATLEILKHTILMLIPSPNPDGIDLVANWYRKTIGTPYEGSEPPELYHHYAGHDNNRDWFMLNLKETQVFTGLFWKEWFPQIVYDVHQQSVSGSRFFVPPFYDPPNPRIAPLVLRHVGLIGHKIAADLQAAGFKGVITNALYDTWWHGGFRTAPYFHDSIGILSEAASTRLMTPSTVTRDQLAKSTARGMPNALVSGTNFPDPWPGGQWHPRDILNMELLAAKSILSIASKYRQTYLENFYELNHENLSEDVGPGAPIAYLIPAGQGHDEAVAKLIAVLIGQGVEVHRLDGELHAAFGPQILQRTSSPNEKGGAYRSVIEHASGLHEVPAGSYIVFLAQPQRRNVLALFEPQIYPERIGPQGEAERPYDVTGWTLSMQMGLDVPAVITIQEPPRERRLTLIRGADEVRRDLALALSKDGQSPIHNPLKQNVRLGIYKSWLANADEGWTRFICDTFNVPYRSLTDAEIKQGDLSSKFDVLVLPSQRPKEILEGRAAGTYPSEFTGGLTATGVNNLKRFVEDGGTLICFDASCEILIKQFNVPLRNVLEGLKSSEFYGPGSIVSLEVDNKEALARGLPHLVDAYFINSSAFEVTGSGVRVIARYAEDSVLRSGWLRGEDKLRGRVALAEVPLGKGQVVLFAFPPQHRGQTWGTLPFIWNAFLLGAKRS